MDIFNDSKKKKQRPLISLRKPRADEDENIGSLENGTQNKIENGQDSSSEQKLFQTKDDIAEQELLREEIAFIVEHEGHPRDGFGFKRKNSLQESTSELQFDNHNPNAKMNN